MKFMKLTTFLLAFSVFSVAGCKKNSSVTPTTTTGTSNAVTITTSTTSALPGSLAIAANTEAVSVAVAKQLAVTGKKVEKQDMESKKKRLKKAEDPVTKADCFVALGGLRKPMNSPTCYGPQLYYTKHPDASSADISAGASTISAPSNTPGATGVLPGGDLGIWSANASSSDSTACAAAKLNSVVQTAAQSVDLAVGATGAMLCVAKMDKLSLPAIGATLDLTTTLSGDADMEQRMTVTLATITREANTVAGRPVYTSKMELSLTPPEEAASNTLSITLRHVPLDDTNTTYKGLMTMVRTSIGKPPKMPEPPKTNNSVAPRLQLTGTTVNASSIVYSNDATHLTYKVVSANYSATVASATIFNSVTGEVDATKAETTTGASDGWNGNLNVLIGQTDASGDGSIAVAWQAGSRDGYTRNFNVSTVKNSDGSRTGTAYFGFAKNLNNAAPKLAIDGMICNWAGPKNQKDTGAGWNLVQKQTMKLNATSGVWEAVTSNITFAPTNNCNWKNLTDSTYSTLPITTAATKGVVTNNLVVKASGYTFTVPTAPTTP